MMLNPYEIARGRLVAAVDMMMQQPGLTEADKRALATFRKRWESARAIETKPERATTTKNLRP